MSVDPAFEETYVTGLLAQDPERFVEARAAANAAAYASLPHRRDIPYGDHARQRFDLFAPEAEQDCPLLVFFHGGYWRANCKDDRAFLAPKWIEQGVAVAIVNYRIAPHGRIADMVEDAVAAVRHLHEHAERYDLDPARIVVCGNSAGAHLAVAASARAQVSLAGVVGVSGLFDLRPLLRTSITDALKLDEIEARACSPALATIDATQTALFVGGEETASFIAQSELYHALRTANCVCSIFSVLSGEDHFSIIDQIANPQSTIGEAIAGLFAN